MQHLDDQAAHAYVVGDLSRAEQGYWDEHLRGCAACRDLVRKERLVSGLLKLDEPISDPPFGPERMLSRVRAAGDPRGARAGRRALACVGALGLGVVLGLGWRVALMPSARELAARDLGVLPEVQEQVVDHLDVLRTLERDPWIAREFGTAKRLRDLLEAGEGG